MAEEVLTLRVAAQLSGQSVIRLGRWCATGRLRCERDGDGWLIPASEIAVIADLAREHEAAVEEKRVTAMAVPLPGVPNDLADQVAARLGLSPGKVSITPLALDGIDYVVAIWRTEASGTRGLPALQELAAELEGELLDGELNAD